MSRLERQRLIAGVFIGLLLAGIIYVATQYITPRKQPMQEPSKTASSEAASSSEPQAAEVSGAPVAIALTKDEQATIGVETTEVKHREIRNELIVPARVAEPETGIGTISARISGRIDKLFLNITGESVSRGQPVASIYSPDVFATAEEFRLALENRRRLNDSKEPRAIEQADELVQASRRRLELWGLTTDQIESLQATASPAIAMTIYSSVSGIVAKRNV